MTNTSAALQLPPELLGTVFRLIRSTSKAAVANRDLAAFALVCRNWHVPATVELYRIFEIKAATGCWPSEEKRFDELTSSSKAELVQVVALRCRGRWDSTNERFWWAEKLPQVRHVELLELAGRDEPAVESLARSVVGLADCLVSLTINGACTKPTQILLTQLPTLTSFTQLGAPSTHGFFLHADLPPPPFRLQQHSLRNAWAPEYLDWLIRNSHTSLSALSLAPFPDAFHPALDLSRSPNLSHLSLPVDIIVEILEFGDYLFSLEDVVDALNSGGLPASLRVLRMGRSRIDNGIDDEDEEREREMLRVKAGERGISVEWWR
ncbi:hypothetical protein JCM8097_001526 [Rhodosporidiobolus ruineniae]